MLTRDDAPALDPSDRQFPAAFAMAVAVHIAVLAWLTYVAPARQLGEASGRQDGVTVEIVDESEVPNSASAAPAPQAAPTPTPQAPPAESAQPAPPAPPAPAAPSEPPAEAAVAPAAQPAPVETSPAEPQPQTKSQPIDLQDPSLLSLEPPPSRPQQQGRGQGEAAKKPAKPAPQLSLTLPDTPRDVPIDLQGRSAGVSRPEGITRSGLNDEFGRNVIKALRQTLPGHSGISGQAVVRFELSDNGNLVEVHLVSSSRSASLDQSVLFSVRQASFPIPPGGLTRIDRQFRVTYIYR